MKRVEVTKVTRKEFLERSKNDPNIFQVRLHVALSCMYYENATIKKNKKVSDRCGERCCLFTVNPTCNGSALVSSSTCTSTPSGA